MELLHEKLAPLLGQRLMMMVEQKIQQAEIQLDPPELGSLMVRIQVNQDQAHVSFVAQHAHAKDALEQALPKLKEMFQQQNMDLVQADVSQQKQQGGQQGESAQAQGQQSSQQKSTESQMEPQSRSQPQQNVLQTGKVDYYA